MRSTAFPYLQVALDSIRADDEPSRLFGPSEFLAYCEKNDITPPRSTPSVLSVDTLSRLPQYLKAEKAMVFRLGGSDRALTRTRFALVRVSDGPECFFLDDSNTFPDGGRVHEADPLGEERFFGYRLGDKLQEMALVNLGLGSGFLGERLGLEDPIIHAPAMFNTRYSFRLRLHDEIPEIVEHRAGQVQIDSLFTARRDGRLHLFVLEAKFGKQNGSLAKHKLVYPHLSMRQGMGWDGPIVPIYLSVLERPDHYLYRMAECVLEEDRTEAPVLTGLRPVQTSQVAVPKRGALRR